VSIGTKGFALPLSTIRLWEACRKISEAFIFVAIAVVAVALSAMISGAGPVSRHKYLIEERGVVPLVT
jgi:hypothetical protein